MDTSASEPGCKGTFAVKFISANNPISYMAQFEGKDSSEKPFSLDAVIETNAQLPGDIGFTRILEKDFITRTCVVELSCANAPPVKVLWRLDKAATDFDWIEIV